MNVKIKFLSPLAKLPEYQSKDAAGADLYAALAEPLVIEPGETALIPTGIALECERTDVAVLIFARSGLAVKRGLGLANGVGVVDSDYRGEIKVALHNHSLERYEVSPGERIAQMAFVPVLRAEFEAAEELNATQRGDGGFGHSGKI